MKRKRIHNALTAISAFALIGLVMGCAEKNLYNPDLGKEPLPDPNEYFGFEMRNDVKLSIDYDAPGFTTLIEVYGENPMETVEGTPVKKEEAEALFKIYTDDNGRYEGKMSIPTSVNTIYLYTETWGLPRCIKLEIQDGTVTLDLSRKTKASNKASSKATTRSYTFTGSAPYRIDEKQNLYSLCQWGDLGNIELDSYAQSINPGYFTNVKNISSENMGNFVKRMMDFFNPKGISNVDNSRLVRESKTTNLSIKEDGTTLDVVFVNRDAANNNTFGYYYFKTGEGIDIQAIRKYIVFPNVAIAPSSLSQWGFNILKCGDKVRLTYYDDNGKANDKFPAGYTVGWFIYANGYVYNEISSPIPHQDEIDTSAPLITSNSANVSLPTAGFISIYDNISEKTIIGVEDGANKSYCDLLFYVDATPKSSIDDPNRPEIDDDQEDPVKPDPSEKNVGTLAFEDVWPSGGDYDMNDVVVEYKRAVSFNTKNMITQIIDEFTPVHDGATFRNAFAYQIESSQLGKITSSNEIKIENETSSVIVFPDVKQNINQTYTIIRTFDTNSTFKKEDLKQYNPYIIVKYDGNSKRTEVHLPKYSATSMADIALIGSEEDAYYIDRAGSYPFAIDIPKLNFKTVTETHRIDSEYPEFAKWAESKGTKHTDWYNNYISSK